MALDSKLTQNINLRANGDQLLRPMEAFGKAIGKVIRDIENLNGKMSSGSHKQQDEMRKQVQLLQRLIGEASTLQNVLNSGNKRKQGLFGGLDDVAMGKKTLSASKLKLELDKAKTSADALEIRLAQLHKSFAALGNRGVSVKQADLTKALKAQEALQQVRQLEQQINRLDARYKAKGGLSAEGKTVRGQISSAQETLLSRVQNGRRINWDKEIASLQILTERYRDLEKVEKKRADEAAKAATKKADKVAAEAKKSADAEEREAKRAADAVIREANRKKKADQDSALKRRQSALEAANLNEAQLRSAVNRGASRYNFTPNQARGFNVRQLDTQIDGGIRKLQEFQQRLSSALGAGRPQKEIDRLSGAFQRLKDEISEATAKKKAFDTLPEQRMSKMNQAIFGDGNWKQFGARIGGAALIGSVAFGAINAAKDSVQYVIQLEDAMARLQAISGATDPEIKKLGQSIVELGGMTRYSTLEIAEAATQIAQAGFSASEAGKVLEASLMLAAGSGSTVAEGVDTMTSSLGAFQLQASEAAHVADVLMEGLNQSKLSITQMQAALQYAGATAKETGMTLEELTAVAASLANAGIRNGSTIGTGIRQLLVDLQTPSEKFQKELKSLGLTLADVDVRAKGLAGVVKTLTDAGFSAEQAFEGFEVRAASAFLAFRNQIDTYDELSLALTQTGAAAAANERAMDSLSAKWTQTKNTLGELIALLSIPFVNAAKVTLDAITGMVGGLNSIINALAGASEASGQWGGVLMGTLLPALAGFFLGGGVLGAVVGGLLGFVGALQDAGDASEELAAKTDESAQKLKESRETISSVDDAIERLIQRGEGLKKNHQALQVEVLNLTGKFDGLATHIDATKLSYEGLMDAMVKYRGLKLAEEGEKAREVMLNSVNEGRPVLQGLATNTAAIGRQANNARQAGPAQFRNSPALIKYQQYANAAAGKNYATMGGEGLLQEQVTVRGLINDLRALGEGNTYIDAMISKLNDRLQKLQKVGELRGNITQSQAVIGMVEEINSEGGQERQAFLLETRQKVTEGLSANKAKKGSGDRMLDQAMNQSFVRIKNMQQELKSAPAGSAKFKALTQSINDLQAEVNRVRGVSDRETEAMLKEEKAGPGEDLTGTAVAALVRKKFSGANVYSYGKRDYATQVRLYAKYKAGKGPLAAKPGTSNHGSGHALDMTPIPGMDIDQVGKFIESRGVELTEQLNERDPTTGRFHWHFAWKPKTSSFQKAQNSEAEKAERELQELLEQEAGYTVKGAQSRIATIINQGKSGSLPPTQLVTDMDAATADLRTKKLAEFDTKNPTAGASAQKQKYIANARKALDEAITEEIANYNEQLYRTIADNASQLLQAALEAADRKFEDAQYENAAGVRAAQSDLAAAGNRTNRNNVGDGTMYRLQLNAEKADLATDKANLIAMQGLINDQKAAIADYEAKLKTMVAGSKEYNEATREKEAAVDKLNQALREQAVLQGKVNDQERKVAQGPLGQRLKDAARAWAENSGAMDSWAKKAENAVAPTLDFLTSGLTDLFASIMDGSKSVKQALGDFLKSFAQFVIQMIAKALALVVVKQILTALGVPMPTGSFEGGPVKGTGSNDASAGKAAYNGGPVIPGRYTGGNTHPRIPGGGPVNRGVRTRDSALYNLAAGEYVVRGKSVRDIGLANMEMINKHGAKGLKKVTQHGGFMNIQAPRQETNVYVVSEKQKPSLSTTDVLVTIQDDILQGGVTKKLIKHVAQGG